ncbi:MAG: hypothetical protein K2N56_09480, partial [Oscillospiraceae bacterium]|nr:hypothetical protein [Oscillospiraceae bacterium]
MKLKNNILALVLSLGLALTASGCSDSNRAANSGSDDDRYICGGDVSTERHNRTALIYNSLNEEIGSFNGETRLSFVDGSILYTKANENDPFDPELEYWLYDIETKENHKLGAFADSYYYAVYESLKHDGHLYISVSSGDSFHFAGSTMTVYDIDLSEYSMKPLLEIKGGVPYNSFTVANNKLIVAELLYNGDTDLVEYDLSQKYDGAVVHAYDESDCFVHDSIRHIYADSENIYMVRLDWDESKENYFLYLDKYDF